GVASRGASRRRISAGWLGQFVRRGEPGQSGFGTWQQGGRAGTFLGWSRDRSGPGSGAHSHGGSERSSRAGRGGRQARGSSKTPPGARGDGNPVRFDGSLDGGTASLWP